MNHIYRLVWSQRHSKFVVAHEKTRASGCSSTKVSSSVASVLLSSLLVSPFAWAAPPTANTLPTGAQVTAGAAAITSSGNTMNVQQSTQRAAINWTNFSIGSNATVNFQQPNASAVVLNRVVGNEQSVINGALNANGQVFLLNSSGVLFGQGAQVNVGGLVASTLNMTDADFMAGRNTLQSTGSQASVINLGQITAADGGYVALLGNQVSNQGVISARLGTAALAAGDKISLNFNGNSLIGVTIDQGTLNALVENKQAIYADGGRVYLTTQAVDTVLNGVVNNTGLIQANSVGTGQNGEVILFAHGGTVDVGGTINADGGFIETSGKQFAIQPNATVQAANWLIDPVNITIDSTLAGTIQTALGSGNVTISTAGNNTPSTTSGQSGTDGDITVNSNISWSANNMLTLHADRNIHINAAITASGASGAVTLEYGQGAVAASNTSTYDFGLTSSGFAGKINLQAGQNFNTKLGSDGTAVNWTVITALGSAGDEAVAGATNSLQGLAYSGRLSGLSANYVLGANIDASSTSSWNSGAGFVPIGSSSSQFSGSFDGLGHSIQGLVINRSATYQGLFGKAGGGSVTFRNLGIVKINGVGSVSGGSDYTGALLGGSTYSAGTVLSVSGVYSDMSVSGSDGVGGLVGNSGSRLIVNSSFSTGNVTSTGIYVGGLVGQVTDSSALSTIDSSYATGNVAASSRIGGLIGRMTGSISYSYASGSVTASGSSNTEIGGLAGKLDTGSPLVYRSYASGNVTRIGAGYGTNIGGLIGFSYAPVEESFATGDVTATVNSGSIYIGGLIGSMRANVLNSYSTGNVSGGNSQYDSRIGGLVGRSTADITNSISTGIVTAVVGASTLTVGGLVGEWQGSTTTASYWDTASSNQSNSAAGTGDTTSNLQTLTLFSAAGWSIAADNNLPSSHYPRLRWSESSAASGSSIWIVGTGSNSSSNSSNSQSSEVERQVASAIHAPREITRPHVPATRESESGSTKPFSNVAVVPTDMSVAFNKGDPLALLSSPDVDEPTQTVSLTDAKKMLKPSTTGDSSSGSGTAGSSEVRVPVSRNSLAEIVNGGVKLPTGVEQQLFVVKAN